VEELWAAMVACWPKNLRIIIRYLFIVSGMAPNELIEYVSEANAEEINVELPLASTNFRSLFLLMSLADLSSR